MQSLRARLLWTTGLMAGLQLLSTGLALVTWTSVLQGVAHQEALADWRAAVDALREASRETYVHQAHTFIEGGTAHLDHLEEADEALDARIRAVADLPLPEEPRRALVDVEAAVVRARTFFRDDVVPLAERGALDRPAAAKKHAQAETLAGAVMAATDQLATALERAQSSERARVSDQTRFAWLATAGLTASSVVLALVLAGRLRARVLGPIERLRQAAMSFGAGRTAQVAEDADEELAALAVAFNQMTAAVLRAQGAQVRAERLAALGEMSAAVAHELMSPLTVMLGHPMMRAPELAPVREEAEHARRVVAGLLGFARPGEEAPEDLDLGDAVRDAVCRLEADAELADVHLIQAEGPSLRARLPPGAVRHVLDNLLRNAVQASAPGQRVEVRVCAGPMIEVRDRGPGIAPAVRARLYEPFVTGRADGTGLGLAVCQRIARGTGGNLEHVERREGGTIARWHLGPPWPAMREDSQG